MVDQALIDALVTGGPVAVLALIIFLMYRRDRKSSECEIREDRKFMEDRLTKLMEHDQQTREANTKALAELISFLKGKSGSR